MGLLTELRHLFHEAREHLRHHHSQQQQQQQQQPPQPFYQPPQQAQSYPQQQQAPQHSGAWGQPAVSQPSQPYQHVQPPQQQQSQSAPAQNVDVKPTQQELNNLNAAVERMWSLDSNRLQPGRDLKLNLQRSTKVHMTVDNASEPLFANMTTDIFRQRPTYQHFASLLDNYIAENGTAEVVGHNELGEQNAFIEALLGTHPIQYLHQILIAKNLAPNGIREFGEMLKCIWFGLYKRQVHNDSSAFEHTFIGEIKPGQGVVGFHNWIQLFFEELKGHADYRGYILPRNRNSNAPPPENSHVLSIQLAWKGEVKPVSTFFIGTSPEFEIALYTLVFLAGAEDNQVTIEGVDVNLKCHKFRNNQGMRLGSCYPISG